MENISQMSLLEVATELMEQKRTAQNIYALIKEVLEMKGIVDEDNTYATQLYIDITTSSKFVYMGNDEWDLKLRQSLDEFDKDGSAFNTLDDIEDDEVEDLDEDDLDDDLDDFDDEEDDDDEDEDEEEDEYDDDSYDEDDLDDDDEDIYDDEDDLDDGEDLERYTEEGFNEDKYNDYMDDYEDMYEN